MKKSKAVISVLLAIVALLTMSVVYVAAATEEGTEGYYTFTKFNSKVTITDVNPAISGSVVVPATLDGCDVITIGQYAFEGCDKVTSITVPDCITTIDRGAFKGMTALESVTVPFTGKTENATNYTSTFGFVFDYTSTETEGAVKQNGYYYYIPASVKNVTVTSDETIPDYAFCGMTNLEEATLDTAESIGNYAFNGCESLKKADIGDEVTSVGNYAFQNCKALTELPFSDSLKTIGSYAYENISNITTLAVPDSVTSIGQGAFKGLNNLVSVTVPFVGNTPNSSGYAGVFGYIFDYTTTSGVSGTTQQYSNYYYYIPTSIKTVKVTGSSGVPSYAFYNCANLTDVTFDSAKSVGDYAFVGCEKISELKLGDSLETIGSYAFSDFTQLTELSFPSTLKTIGSYAFQNCTGITELVVPDSVTMIYDGAFMGMNSLESIILPFVGKSIDATLYYKHFGFIFGYGSGTESTAQNYIDYYIYTQKYLIPKSLRTVTLTKEEKIGYGSFQNCSFLTEINIPETVTSIGEYAFNNCSGIKEINIPEGITEINAFTFSGCTSLGNVTLPQSLTKISADAFNGCNSFTSVVIPDAVKSIGNYAFSGCDNLETVKFSANLETIGDYAFNGCSKITALNFPATLKTIGSYAFQNCTGITELVVPDSVTMIYDGAFMGMNSLESIILPFVGKSIDATLYYKHFGFIFGYGSGTESTAQNYIDYYIYTQKYLIPKSLRTVTLTKEEKIGYGSFQNCSFLTEINIPETVTSIGEYAFQNCSGLTALHISNNVTSVGQYAFSGCTNLTVYGHSGSYIETYCTENNVPFVAYEKVSSLSVTKLPENKQYPGKPVDTTGMEITATLSDGTKSVIKRGFTVTPAIVPAGGQQTITVNFGKSETTFNINALNVNGVSLISEPSKTNYVVGDTLDLNGLKLQVYYSDGTTAIATDGFVSNVDTLESAGTKLITVTYYGKTVKFRVSVVDVKASVLEIETMPVKTEYFVGDEIDTTGLVIKATYNNGKTASITGGFTVKTVLDSADITEVVIEHAGKTVSYPVKVTAVVSTGWILETEPSKLNYIIGESIDTTGITLTEFFNNGSVVTVTEGFTCTPESFTESGNQIVTLSYKDSSTMFVVYVHDSGSWSYAGNNVFERKCYCCDEILETKTVYLSLNAETLEIYNHGAETLVATVTDNFDCKIIFSSSDDSVVSVDEKGKITAESVGNATVTAMIKDTDIVASCDITVLPVSYTLIWDIDGKITEIKLDEGAEIIKPADPEKVGYKFIGWTPEVPDVMPASDLTIIALFSANSYNAVFDANGGKFANGEDKKTVATLFESQIIIPEAPSKQGYVFAGWTPEVPETQGAGDAKYTAVWASATDVKYTVETYTMNTDGEYEKSSKTLYGTTGEVAKITPEVPDGFTLNSEKSVLSGVVSADGSLVLKVYLDRVKQSIEINGKPGEYLEGEEIPEPEKPETPEGYEQEGWVDENGNKVEFPLIADENTPSVIKPNYVKKSYTVTWIVDGVETKETYKYGDKIVKPADPVKQGYVFAGWTPEVPETQGADDAKYTAVWASATDVKYTVETYTMNTDGEYEKSSKTLYGTTGEVAEITPVVSDGFTLNAEKSVLSGVVSADGSLVLKVYLDRNKTTIEINGKPGEYLEGEEIPEPEKPETPEGYEQEGWVDENGNKVEFPLIADENTPSVIKPNFVKKSYTVTWVVDGVETKETYKYGDKIVKPADPVKQGYVFAGWTPEVPETQGAGDAKYTAVWASATDVTYTVETYTMNTDGEYEKSSKTLYGTTGEVAKITPEVPDGFTLNSEKSVLSGIVSADGSLVLKVYYDRNKTTIEINGKPGEYLEGEEIPEPEKPETPEGYEQDGWVDENGNKVEFPLIADENTPSVIKPNYVKKSYTVTWVVDGVETKETYKYGDKIVKPADPVKQGYVFAGWTPEVPETQGADDAKYTAVWASATDVTYTVETYTMNTDGEYEKSSKTLYGTTGEVAKITPEVPDGFTLNAEKSVLSGIVSADGSLVLKVYYDRNKTTIEINGKPGEYLEGEEIPEPEKPETPEGYEQDGWIDENGNKVEFPLIADENTPSVIKPNYVKKSYTVTWVVDGVETKETYKYGDKIVKPADPVKQGYVFAGWTPEVPETQGAGDAKYTAVWASATDVTYTVETYTMNTDGEYEKSSKTLYGTTGEVAKITPEVPDGFTLNAEKSVLSGIVSADGSLVLKVYLDRNKTTIEINGKPGEYLEGEEIPEPEKSETPEGYEQDGWVDENGNKVEFPLIADENTPSVIKPNFVKKSYTVTWVVDSDEITAKVMYQEKITKPFDPGKSGFKFMGWSPDVPDTMPAKDMTFTAVFEKLYVCPDCGEEILGENAINEHIVAEARMKATVKIKNNKGSKTINYGETLQLTAIVTDKPADVKIYWYVDGVKKGEGEVFDISFESGTKTVEVKLVDSDGKVLTNSNGTEISDSESVTVNAGFFQKIISFFKNLFGMNRTVIQSLFKGII